MKPVHTSLIALSLLLAACGDKPASVAPTAATPAADAAVAPAAEEAAPKLPGSPATDAAIRAEDLAAHLKILASDDFGGRQPGGAGERKTVAYLEREFARIGLAPGNGDSYRQAVPMVEISSEPKGPVAVRLPDGSTETLALGSEVVIQTLREDPEVVVSDSELVFVGLRRQRAGARLERLRAHRRHGQDRGRAGQRSRLRDRRRAAVPRQGDDLLRPLDLQVRGSLRQGVPLR
jgi:hypothetical protein